MLLYVHYSSFGLRALANSIRSRDRASWRSQGRWSDSPEQGLHRFRSATQQLLDASLIVVG